MKSGEWSASSPSRFTSEVRNPGTHFIGFWVGRRASLDAVAKRKQTYLHLSGIEPWSSSPKPSLCTELPGSTKYYPPIMCMSLTWAFLDQSFIHLSFPRFWSSDMIDRLSGRWWRVQLMEARYIVAFKWISVPLLHVASVRWITSHGPDLEPCNISQGRLLPHSESDRKDGNVAATPTKQWLHGLRSVHSLAARTFGSWVQISLRAWMYSHFLYYLVLSRYRPCSCPILHLRSPTICLKCRYFRINSESEYVR
jgi:hypothetical protein